MQGQSIKQCVRGIVWNRQGCQEDRYSLADDAGVCEEENVNITRQEGGRCGEGKSRTESGVAVGQGRGGGWTGGRSSNLLKGERRREIKWYCDFFLSRAVLQGHRYVVRVPSRVLT